MFNLWIWTLSYFPCSIYSNQMLKYQANSQVHKVQAQTFWFKTLLHRDIHLWFAFLCTENSTGNPASDLHALSAAVLTIILNPLFLHISQCSVQDKELIQTHLYVFCAFLWERALQENQVGGLLDKFQEPESLNKNVIERHFEDNFRRNCILHL